MRINPCRKKSKTIEMENKDQVVIKIDFMLCYGKRNIHTRRGRERETILGEVLVHNLMVHLLVKDSSLTTIRLRLRYVRCGLITPL